MQLDYTIQLQIGRETIVSFHWLWTEWFYCIWCTYSFYNYVLKVTSSLITKTVSKPKKKKWKKGKKKKDNSKKIIGYANRNRISNHPLYLNAQYRQFHCFNERAVANIIVLMFHNQIASKFIKKVLFTLKFNFWYHSFFIN